MLSKAHDAITRIHPGEWSAQRPMNLSWPRGLVTGQGKFQTFFALAPGNIGPREKWQEVIWIHTFPQRVPAGEGGVQFSSVSQSCLTLCSPMNRSTPGLPVHHHLPEFTQIHVHRVSVAIQPSHPQSSPSSLAPNPSQHQSLFQWVNSSHEVAKVLELQL